MDFTGEWITRDGSRAIVVANTTKDTHSLDGRLLPWAGEVKPGAGALKFSRWDEKGNSVHLPLWDLIERYVPPEQRR